MGVRHPHRRIRVLGHRALGKIPHVIVADVGERAPLKLTFAEDIDDDGLGSYIGASLLTRDVVLGQALQSDGWVATLDAVHAIIE